MMRIEIIESPLVKELTSMVDDIVLPVIFIYPEIVYTLITFIDKDKYFIIYITC